MSTITKQRYVHIGVKAPISNSRGSHSRSVITAPRRAGQRRSVIMKHSPSLQRKKLANGQILSAKIAAADASALNRSHPDPSVWPSSRRSAYGVRSAVPAPAPRHRLSNKRMCCTQKENWLADKNRPSLYIQNRPAVRGFNSRFLVVTPGVTRGQQVRSFAKAPSVWHGKEVEQSGECDATTTVMMVGQAGRGSFQRNLLLGPAVAGDNDRATATIGRVPADRSTIVEQTRAYTARSFAAPRVPNNNIWAQEHLAVQQEWESHMMFLAQEYEHIELAIADHQGGAANALAERAVGQQTPLSPPPARKQEPTSVLLLASSTTYPIRPKSKTALIPKQRFWECCECMNKNYMFREECGRCEFPQMESVRVSTPIAIAAC